MSEACNDMLAACLAVWAVGFGLRGVVLSLEYLAGLFHRDGRRYAPMCCELM